MKIIEKWHFWPTEVYCRMFNSRSFWRILRFSSMLIYIKSVSFKKLEPRWSSFLVKHKLDFRVFSAFEKKNSLFKPIHRIQNFRIMYLESYDYCYLDLKIPLTVCSLLRSSLYSSKEYFSHFSCTRIFECIITSGVNNSRNHSLET